MSTPWRTEEEMMKYNIQTMMKLRSAWHTFRDNHPNLPPFLKDVLKKGIKEDVPVCL